MKQRAPRTCLALSCLLLAWFAVAGASDQPLPDAPVGLHGGGTFKLTEIVGDKPVYLKFWASWCGTCREQMPHLESTYERYADDLNIVSVNIWVNESEQAIDATIGEFGLTVPIAIDGTGAFAQAFELVGTPYHVLIDGDGEIVHTGSDADAELDRKIELLASSRTPGLLPIASASAENTATSWLAPSDGISVLFFTATWCDWYLEDSRPSMSAACIDAQRSMNQLHVKQPDLKIQGIASRLWTGDEELEDYIDKYAIPFPMAIDASNETFFSMNVNSVPTLVVLKDGLEVARTSELRSADAVAAFIRSADR